MKVAVWNTGHFIADKVAESLLSLPNSTLFHAKSATRSIIKDHDIHIGYGILRGMDDVFKACDRDKKPWFDVDRGYFRPNHFGGTYRVTLSGTQPTNINIDDYKTINKKVVDFDAKPWRGVDCSKSILICPPTDYAVDFFNINVDKWKDNFARIAYDSGIKKYIFRPKGTERPLQQDLDKAGLVVTFNSAVGWEAMRQGIPVMSDQDNSLIGSTCRGLTVHKTSELQRDIRLKLFNIMEDMQLTLKEMEDGKLWPLMQHLMSL